MHMQELLAKALAPGEVKERFAQGMQPQLLTEHLRDPEVISVKKFYFV